jgi:glycosyltransferase involved in cell wall biosynthesis
MAFPAIWRNKMIPTELTILLPCLNEQKTLATCIHKARSFLLDHHINGEVLVADNGSSDGSQEIAKKCGARVITIEEKGYGAALMGGIRAARGKFIIMGDSDESYDFSNLLPFLEKLRAGNDLVMGNRFTGGIQPGAMPFLHRYLGNPILSWLGRLFFRTPIRDFHCGLRGFSRQAILDLDLRTTGMEFASEMVVKASLAGLKVTEVPTRLYPDRRDRPPHLKPWRDGWRHLRFLLLYSPRWLFLYPGLAAIGLGLAGCAWLLPGPHMIVNVVFDINSLFFFAGLILIGYQMVNFAVITRVFGLSDHLLLPDNQELRFLETVTLERGILTGFIMAALGMAGSAVAIAYWKSRNFGNLDPAISFRLVIPGMTLLLLGTQTILSSFLISIIGLKRKLP